MYAPRGTTTDKLSNDMKKLKNDLASGKITQDQYKILGKEKINQYEMSGPEGPPSRVEEYLVDKGLINPGDLSYTPKAFDEIAWSGLTTPSKRAIGFGINPFEDTRAAGQFYKQQKYKKMSQAKKQAQMQETIRQAEAAKKKVITTGGPPSITQKKTKPKVTGPTYGPHKKTKVKVKAKHSPHGGGPGGGGGSKKSGGGHKAPGGGGYGPHRGGRNPWGRAGGGLIDVPIPGRSRYI